MHALINTTHICRLDYVLTNIYSIMTSNTIKQTTFSTRNSASRPPYIRAARYNLTTNYTCSFAHAGWFSGSAVPFHRTDSPGHHLLPSTHPLPSTPLLLSTPTNHPHPLSSLHPRHFMPDRGCIRSLPDRHWSRW